jgi:hypothetical protein
MVIYKIENDGFRFQELDLDVFDFQSSFPDEISTLELHQFSENNLSLAKYWPSMSTGFFPIDGGENLVPDVSCWIGATLLLSPRAHRLLGETLMPFGEFLPIWIENDIYQIFNCLTVCTAAGSDDSTIEFDRGDAKNKVIFKPGKDFECHIYCLDQLRNAIESFKLKGVVFQEFGNN